MQGVDRGCRAIRRLGALALVLTIAGAAPVYAQFDRGTISGTIKDASGGVVPGVTVTVTSTSTQQARTTVSDGSGFYTFPNLQPGRYDVSAELQGFKKNNRAGVQLDAASTISIDFALDPGSVTEEVTVTAEASIMQTDVAVRKTVEAKDIELLAFNGRNPIGVPALKAGVIGGSFNNAGAMSLTAGGFNINGGRSDEAVVYVDGAVATRTRSAGSMIGVQNADTVQEVQVLTANYMPEYGRSSAGQIRFISKSGSSRYSGNASFFFRDDKLQANHLGAQPQPERVGELRPRAVRPEAVPVLVRRPDPRIDVQGQAVLLRRAGVGQLLRGQHEHGHGADPEDAQRRLRRAAGFQPVLQHAADHPQPGDRPAVPGQCHSPRHAVVKRHGDHEAVSGADCRLPAGHRQRDFQQRQPAGSAEGQHPAGLPVEQQQPDHVPFPAIELGGDRLIPRDVPICPYRLGAAEPHRDIQLDEHDPEQPDQRLQLLPLARRSVHQRVHRERPAQAQPHRNQLPVHLSGQGDRRQDSRRSISTHRGQGSTAGRTRHPRQARSIPFRTPPLS